MTSWSVQVRAIKETTVIQVRKECFTQSSILIQSKNVNGVFLFSRQEPMRTIVIIFIYKCLKARTNIGKRLCVRLKIVMAHPPPEVVKIINKKILLSFFYTHINCKKHRFCTAGLKSCIGVFTEQPKCRTLPVSKHTVDITRMSMKRDDRTRFVIYLYR